VVYGLEKFEEYFKDLSKHYVLIGGTACEILLSEMGVPFRSTKDLDVVLILESLDETFGETFWRFINDGDYEYREKNINGSQFYRFSKPKNDLFPRMIELFSRKPLNTVLKFENGLIPIHIDDKVTSLSALLLSDDYYDLLKNGKKLIGSCCVIDFETMILFKIKAWVDLNDKVKSKQNIDHRNIKKHKNDIFRLLVNVVPSQRIHVSETVKNDVLQFAQQVSKEKTELKDLGIRNSSVEDLLKLLTDIFL
jgi:hypothetical protein